MRRTVSMFIAPFAVASLLLASCGDANDDARPVSTGGAPALPDGSAPEGPSEPDDAPTADASTESDPTVDVIDEMTENLEEQQEDAAGGHATFIAGDETWEFDDVLCKFASEGTDEGRATFILTSLQDGLQLHLMISATGHRISLNDVEDFENPSVALTTSVLGTDDFLVLKGKNVSGETIVYADGDPAMTEVPATVEGSCP